MSFLARTASSQVPALIEDLRTALPAWTIGNPENIVVDGEAIELRTRSWEPLQRFGTQQQDISVLSGIGSVAGDFDATVRFHLSEFERPRSGRNEAALTAYDDTAMIRVARLSVPHGAEYLFQTTSDLAIAEQRSAAEEREGTLRMLRRKDRLCGEYLDGGNWRQLACTEVRGGIRFGLSIFAGNWDRIRVRFTDFRVTRTP
jgi:hypothetical protein